MGAQSFADDDTAHTVDTGGHTPRRVTDVTARAWPPGAKRAHDTGQAFSPVARAKSPTTVGDTQDIHFFGSV
jgi:hypothetical protein